MKELYLKLKQIYDIRKSKTKVRSSRRILHQQLKTAKFLTLEIIERSELDNSQENQIICEKAKQIYGIIKQLVRQKEEDSEIISFKGIATAIIFTRRLKESAKMASILEIAKIVPQLVQIYNGDGEKLTSVIASLKACKALVTDDNRAVATQIILSRLEGKARSAVGDNPRDIDFIIEKLTDKCKSTTAPETIVAKMNATKQTSEVTRFTEQIEKLTMDLERAYINEKVPVDTAARMSVKAGIKALSAGVRNNETKLLLKAGQFNTLSAAVEKITENESTINGSNSVLHYRTQNFGNNQYRNNRFPNNSYRNRSTGNHTNNFNRNDRYPQREYRNPNANYRRNSSNNVPRFPRNERRGPGSRVFVAQAGNLAAPQQIIVGGPRQNQTENQNRTQVQNQTIHHIQRPQ